MTTLTGSGETTIWQKHCVTGLCVVAICVILTGCASVAPAGVPRKQFGGAASEPAGTPVHQPLPPPGRPHYQAARSALVAGDLHKAAREVKLALQDDPRDAAAHFLLGCLLERTGENDQALVAFQQAVVIDPANPEALHNLGTMLLRRGEALPAARILENAVLVRPGYVPSYNNLAKAYYLAGLPELAIATYEEALRRDPSNGVALRNLLLLAEGAGLKDAAAVYRQRLQALGPGPAAKPAIDRGEPLVSLPTWPVAGRATGVPPPAPAPVIPEQQGRPDPEVEALRAQLRDLPHVSVERRAGRLTLTGWTSGEKEKDLLARVIGKPSEVLNLTTEDVGDSRRMIEVDAILFIVTALDLSNVGFNFLNAITMNFKYATSDNRGSWTGFLPNGTVGTLTALSSQGWFFGASADYLVNIANASEEAVAILARPHLTTLSQTPADFLAGGELVYKVSGNISGDIKPYPYGTKLTVTPTLLRTPAEDGTPRVHLKVMAERKSILSLLDQDPNQPTPFTKVTVSGEAVLAIDQTLILSGLSQRESHTGRSGVPYLRDIPILKYFFSTRMTIVADVAIVILLTPRDASFADERNQRALTEFIEQRRAYLRAKQGGEDEMRRFRERYPGAETIPPNRFASYVFLMQTSELYRAVSPVELTSEDLNLDLLGPRPEW